MLARVSNIEAYRRWKNWRPLHDEDAEPTIEDLVRQITVDDPSPSMQAGTAFHSAMEQAAEGEYAARNEVRGWKHGGGAAPAAPVTKAPAAASAKAPPWRKG